MITSLEIENFKAIGSPGVRIDIKPITLLFGPNSSGKSTIIQALHLLREIIRRGNVDPDKTELGGGYLDLGGFRNFVHDHDAKKVIRICIDLDLTDSEIPDFLPNDDSEFGVALASESADIKDRMERARLCFEIGWSELTERPQVIAYETEVNGVRVSRIESSRDGKDIRLLISEDPFHAIGVDYDQARDEQDELLHYAQYYEGVCIYDQTPHIIRAIGEELSQDHSEDDGYATEFALGKVVSAVPVPSMILDFDPGNPTTKHTFDGDVQLFKQLPRIFSILIVGPLNVLYGHLDKFTYLGPIREIPSRDFRRRHLWDDSEWATGFGAWYTLMDRGPKFTRTVGNWLSSSERLNTGYAVELRQYRQIVDSHLVQRILAGEGIDVIDQFAEELKAAKTVEQVVVVDQEKGLNLSPYDVGIGISQVLPVVVAALDSADVTAIEQPELHIHPAVQVGLGDLFIHAVTENKDRLFLIETHSEHLMLRLLRRIRETSESEGGEFLLTPEQLSVNYCETDSETDRLAIHALRITKDGAFRDRWPKGFFKERAKELF